MQAEPSEAVRKRAPRGSQSVMSRLGTGRRTAAVCDRKALPASKFLNVFEQRTGQDVSRSHVQKGSELSPLTIGPKFAKEACPPYACQVSTNSSSCCQLRLVPASAWDHLGTADWILLDQHAICSMYACQESQLADIFSRVNK